jgi:hypothetical protein
MIACQQNRFLLRFGLSLAAASGRRSGGTALSGAAQPERRCQRQTEANATAFNSLPSATSARYRAV